MITKKIFVIKFKKTIKLSYFQPSCVTGRGYVIITEFLPSYFYIELDKTKMEGGDPATKIRMFKMKYRPSIRINSRFLIETSSKSE